MREQYRKLREGVAKLKKDNTKDLTYESGMLGPTTINAEAQSQEPEHQQGLKNSQGSTTGCHHCGGRDHSRISSSRCERNKEYVAARTLKTGKIPMVCGRCGGRDHCRITSSKCPANQHKKSTTRLAEGKCFRSLGHKLRMLRLCKCNGAPNLTLLKPM